LPEVDAVYVKEHEDHYVARSGPNALLKHPVEDVWCVTNGGVFILMATEVAADPTAVKQWMVRIKNKMAPASPVVVVRTWAPRPRAQWLFVYVLCPATESWKILS
jgi:hypothetical protein